MCVSSTRLCLHEIKIFIGKLSVLLKFDIAMSTQNENISHQIVACINSVFDGKQNLSNASINKKKRFSDRLTLFFFSMKP
jgi:hypothetical protein